MTGRVNKQVVGLRAAVGWSERPQKLKNVNDVHLENRRVYTLRRREQAPLAAVLSPWISQSPLVPTEIQQQVTVIHIFESWQCFLFMQIPSWRARSLLSLMERPINFVVHHWSVCLGINTQSTQPQCTMWKWCVSITSLITKYLLLKVRPNNKPLHDIKKNCIKSDKSAFFFLQGRAEISLLIDF